MVAGAAGRQCSRASADRLCARGGAWRRALSGGALSPGGGGLRGGGLRGGAGAGGSSGRGGAPGEMSGSAGGGGEHAAANSPGGASDAAEELTLELDCETQQVRWPAVTERRRARTGPRPARSGDSLLAFALSRPGRPGRESVLSLSSPVLGLSSPVLGLSSPVLGLSSPALNLSSSALNLSSPMLRISSRKLSTSSPLYLPAVSPISSRPSGVVDLETALCQALSNARLAENTAASSHRASARESDEFFSCGDSVSAARTSASSRDVSSGGDSGGAQDGQASPTVGGSGFDAGAVVSGSPHEEIWRMGAGARQTEVRAEAEAQDGLLSGCADESIASKRKSSASARRPSARRSSKPIALPASPLAPRPRHEVTLLSESSDESVVVLSPSLAPHASIRPSLSAAALAGTPFNRSDAAVARRTGQHRRVVDSSSGSDGGVNMRVFVRAFSGGSPSASKPTMAPAAPATVCRRGRVVDSSDDSDGAAEVPMQSRVQARSLPSLSPSSASGDSAAAPKAQTRRFVKASEKKRNSKQELAAPVVASLVSPAATPGARYVNNVSSGASSLSGGSSFAGSESDSSSYQPSAGGRSSPDSSVIASSVASSVSSGVGSPSPRARAKRAPRGAVKGKENLTDSHNAPPAATNPGKSPAGKPRQRIGAGVEVRPAQAPATSTYAAVGTGADREVNLKNRAALTAALLAEYNRTVFSGLLPGDLEITWNDRLRKTAGLTYSSTKGGVRLSRVELSAKVLDRESRLNATLLHELCHVAAWLVQGVSRPPHGEEFRAWADIASARYPMHQVERCHSYAIHAPHRYECQTCGCAYKRHSKSVDTDKQVCGKCRGRIVYRGVFDQLGTPLKPRKESGYARFVRVNYAAVKERSRAKDMAAVSKKLARLWREVKQAQSGGNLLLSPGKLSRLSDLSGSSC
jgi:predicted SprT family Zn-dependent metalloprotease